MAVTCIDNGVTDVTVFKRNPGTFTAIAVQGTETVRTDAVDATGGTLTANTVSEMTAGSGVTVDGLLIKDGVVQGLENVAAMAADGAVTIDGRSRTIFLTKAGVVAATIADPTATTHDGFRLTFIAATANAHTVSNAGGSGFFSSGGATKDVATFGGAIGDGFSVIAYQGKWYIDPRGVTNVTLG